MNSYTEMPHSTPLRVPAKVLVLGEYLALATGQALVYCIPHFFELSETSSSMSHSPFHIESPAGKLFLEISKQTSLPGFHFKDPFLGRGGFGASTAEFSLLYRWVSAKTGKPVSAWDSWEKYQSFFSESSLRPSGVDLISQMSPYATNTLCQIDIPNRESTSCPIDDSVKLIVFSATENPGRKTRTHDHLQELFQVGFPDSFSSLIQDLSKSYLKAVEDLKNRNFDLFAQSVRNYAETLSSVGFEDKDAKEDRIAFQKVPGVLAAKGCGALLSDSVLVLARENHEAVIELGKKRGLTPVWV